MWTDGRYYIQIEKELYPGWKMMKMETGEDSIADYIVKNLPKGITIGLDYHLFSKEAIDEVICSGYNYVDDTNNIIDLLWGKDKPSYKKDKVIILPVKYTGWTVEQKLQMVHDTLQQKIMGNPHCQNPSLKKTRYLVSRLDDIAWTLNLRGGDIDYNPVFFSYGLIYFTPEGKLFHLFTNKEKFNTPELTQYLKDNKITLFDYNDIYKVLLEKAEDTLTVIDQASANNRLYTLATEKQANNCIVIEDDVVEIIKGVKNETELKGYRDANVRDGVALVKFFSWMEQELVVKKRTDLNEYEIGVMNKKCREDYSDLFMGESFPPICAAGPNAAIIHYEQNENLHSDMSLDQVILCDTGAQYLDGTTDITRTAHYGKARDKEREYYTRVLLGNLSLERLIFNKGSKLRDLDAVPRSFLMQVGENYKHGTSHGVGHFLNVHEGPYGKPLRVGNVITNEPGYYEKDNFGIRIENMVAVVEKGEKKLGFENITLVPYERNLIDMNLLSPDMIKYIDDYHQKVWNTLSPLLQNDAIALDYLKRKTKRLNES